MPLPPAFIHLSGLLFLLLPLTSRELHLQQLGGSSREGQDEVEGPGSFANKMWTYRVLLELIHWTDSAAQALHLLHSEKEAEQQQQEL